MRSVKMNVFFMTMLAKVVANQTGKPAQIRRYGRILDVLETALDPHKSWVRGEGKEKITIAQQLESDTPCVEFGMEDGDFDLLKKCHDGFDGYYSNAHEAVNHIDEALDDKHAIKQKISLLDFNKKQSEANG